MKRKRKKKHPRLTDLEILERIQSGNLYCCFETLRVFSLIQGRGCKERSEPLSLAIRLCGRSVKYPFVRIKYKGKRKNIAVHKLAWMQHTNGVIPERYEIHHGEEGPLVWHPRNLTCLTIADHKAKHYDEIPY